MNLISFNVNGVRSAINKGLIEWVKELNPDILCLQEIKLSETELVEPLFVELGYTCHWNPAQKKGYSGVAILSKEKPEYVKYGSEDDVFDAEGRVITAHFQNFTLVNAYFPSGTTGDIRQTLKMKFLDHMTDYLQELRKTHPKIVLCGDVNICHTEIDIHNPKSNKNTSGFLPEERAWVSSFIDLGFIDCFRVFNKDPHNYSWWSYRAGSRGKNLGWRIDYFFSTPELKETLTDAKIHSEIVMSDHCPISLQLSF